MTSEAHLRANAAKSAPHSYQWADLSPFAQGYVEAGLRSVDWYSGPQIDEMKDVDGILPCACGSHPNLSSDNARPDDGWRTLWCRGCLKHVTDWKSSAAEAIQEWNTAREIVLGTPAKFSDLAPATLAAMLKDCERFQGDRRVFLFSGTPTRGQGERYWRDRQAGRLAPTYRSLTLYLGDDGLIYQREAT